VQHHLLHCYRACHVLHTGVNGRRPWCAQLGRVCSHQVGQAGIQGPAVVCTVVAIVFVWGGGGERCSVLLSGGTRQCCPGSDPEWNAALSQCIGCRRRLNQDTMALCVAAKIRRDTPQPSSAESAYGQGITKLGVLAVWALSLVCTVCSQSQRLRPQLFECGNC